MKVEVEAIEGCKRRLAVEAPADVVQQEWERAYGRVQKQARLPGFRKGHVPRSLVKVHFADDVRREVAEHLIPDVYRRALDEARLEPVNEPDLQDVTLEEGAPLSFVALVEVKPEIALAEYKGVEVRHTPRAVTGDELDEALAHMREQQAQFVVVARAAARGDLLVIDWTLTLEGREPSSQQGHQFVAGDASVLPEIDAAGVGMRAGEEREGGVRFAADHRRGELRDKVVEAVLATHAFAVPEALVMRKVGHQIEHARESVRRQGLDPDRLPWDYPKLLGELKPGAEKAVRRAVLLDAIAEREGIVPTDAQVEAELQQLAAASQRPLPAIRRMMEKSGDLATLRRGLRDRMTLDMLVENARITE